MEINFLKNSKRSGSYRNKLYAVDPNDQGNQDGDTGSSTGGGGGGIYAYLSLTFKQTSSYQDFITAYNASYGFTVDANTTWAFDFYKVQTGSTIYSTPQKISLAGADIANTLNTKTGSTGSTQMVQVRPLASEGLVIDRYGLNGALVDNKYVTLQKAIAVAKLTTFDNSDVALTTTVVGANSSTTVDLNKHYRFSCADSRGKQTFTWKITKSAPDLSYQDVNCVEGVDYQMLNSTTLSQQTIDLKFISAVNYKIVLTINGYTISSNPYFSVIGDTSTNQNALAFILTPSTVTTTGSLEILFPKIVPAVSVDSQVDKTTVGGTFTTYAGQLITVTNTLTLSTGYYKVINGSTSTIVAKNDTEWRQLLSDNCNVILEVVDSISGNVVVSRNGLDTQTIVVPIKGNYKIHYKTLVK